MRCVSAARLHAVGWGAASMLAASVVVPMGTAQADQTYYVPASKTWTISGHGYGHGHGMSQYGAQGAALEGLTYTQIVKFYYPGTSWARAKGMVRVLITADYTSDLQVRSRPGLRVRDLADGSSWLLPRGNGLHRWRMLPAEGKTAVQYRNRTGWHRWTAPNGRKAFRSNGEFVAPGPLTMVMPSGAFKTYRGALRIARPSPGAAARDTINVVTMDTYVQGVVPYEMPTSWQQQALRAQSVAARTYAAWQRAQSPNRYYQLCDTTACQVYGGVAAEQTSSNKAVQATAGRILTYRGRPAFTQFSASSGGWTSAGGFPYLPAKRDPYDGFAGNPVHDWSVKVSAAALERAYPAIGNLISARVTKRDGNGEWNGRVLAMVLEGTKGRVAITGDDFRWKLGLRSTWFSIAPNRDHLAVAAARRRQLATRLPDHPRVRGRSGRHPGLRGWPDLLVREDRCPRGPRPAPRDVPAAGRPGVTPALAGERRTESRERRPPDEVPGWPHLCQAGTGCARRLRPHPEPLGQGRLRERLDGLSDHRRVCRRRRQALQVPARHDHLEAGHRHVHREAHWLRP